MVILLLFLFLCCPVTYGVHFNGGTITWEPITPNINSSMIPITITQSYSWTYPTIVCATNVPVSTSGRSSANASLICITDCTTDGGYSTKPVSILTDCQTVSASMGLMTSQRSVNINLTAGAHFYLAYVGSAWAPLNNPAKSGLQWSIVCSIDLRMRSDGFINTPPVASVVSPQYAIVNKTIQITIPASDANPGDDVRCRWSVYTPGSRRRRETDDDEPTYHVYEPPVRKRTTEARQSILVRRKRGHCKNCAGTCNKGSSCCCSACVGTTCTGGSCNINGGCASVTTTVDTPGTLATTSSYPNRQAIDECGGICYPGSVPNGTTLSGCTITFTGRVAGAWYAVALQVEDFVNHTSTTPMSSVPVQLLIYVMDQPTCGLAPVIFPINRCFELLVGVSISFNISAMTLCDPAISDIDSILISAGVSGMNLSDAVDSLTNASVSYSTFTWKPVASQVGSQQLCVLAYTDEQIQSSQYCVTFNVITSGAVCVTTTTTSTTTSTTSTATSTTTSKTTTSTSTTSSTATTTSTTKTTTSTSSSSTSTSTTSTTTTTVTTSTTTTTKTTTSTSTTSTSTTSSTTTSTTSSSTTTTTTTSSSTSTTTSITSTSTTTTTTSTSSTSTTTSTTSISSTSTTTTTTTTSSTSTTTSTTSTSTTTSTTSTSTTSTTTSTTSTSSTSTTTTTTTTSSTSTTTSTTSTSTTTTTTSTSSTSTTTSTTSTSSTSTTTTTTTTSSTSTTTSSTSTSTTTTTTTTSSTSSTTSTTSTSTTTSTTSTSSTSTTTSTASTTTTSTATSTTSTTSTSVTTTTTTSTTATTATTTTITTMKKASSPKLQTNWLLILGISLLSFLLAICCSCYCLYKFWWKSHAKHRSRRNSVPRTPLEEPHKDNLLRRVFAKDRIQMNPSSYNVSTANDMFNSPTLSEFPVDLSDTINPERNLNLSTSSSRQNRPFTIKRVNNSEKPVEAGNPQIQLPNHNGIKNDTTSSIRHSAVIVHRVTKLTNSSEANNNQKDPKTNQIKITKVSKKNTDIVQRERSATDASVSMINLGQSSIEMQSMTDRSLPRDRKRNVTAGISVKRIPRNSTATT